MINSVVLLTDPRYELQHSEDWYVQNILLEDQLLATELQRLGIRSRRCAWSNYVPHSGGEQELLVFRSTWDYFDRFEQFSAWLKSLHGLPTLNPLPLIEWNTDKQYLKDLRDSGVAIPETRFIQQDSEISLESLFLGTGFAEAIIKPFVGGAAKSTFRIAVNDSPQWETTWQNCLAQGGMLFQEFEPAIQHNGEISLIYFGTEYSHAVIKRAKAGDFRVQDDHGGTVAVYQPSKHAVETGRQILLQAPQLPAYARVDLLPADYETYLLMELELIEPELFMRFAPPSAGKFAHVVKNHIISI